ncbi:MAG: alpha,6-mannosyltransferase [Chloroflexia bacterium]|nr:alpha,6-mannosyltransferase [Chloroflexia bacterium]
MSRRATLRSHAWFGRFALLTLVGYVALFLLLQSTILWQIYSPVQDQFPQIFGWLQSVFPDPQSRSSGDIGWGLVGLGLYMVVLVFLFAVYGLSVKWASNQRLSSWASRRMFKRLFAVTAALLLLLMVTREIYAVDVFAYSWFGQIWGVFGDNPYLHVPLEYARRDTAGWLPYLYWQDLPAPYGPIWLILAGGIAKIANLFGDAIAYHVIGHKLLVSASYLFSLWLVWRVAGYLVGNRVFTSAVGTRRHLTSFIIRRRVLTAQQARATQFAIALAFAWNPLMLIEFGISGHNDLLMMTCVLLAVYLHLKGKWQLAVLSLALAFLIKFTAIIFLPGYLWLLLWGRRKASGSGAWSDGLPRALGGAGIFAATCVAFYIPFWQGPTTLNVLYQDPTAQFFVHSFGTMVNRKLPDLLAAIRNILGVGGETTESRAALEAFSGTVARWVPLLIAAFVAVWQTWPARDVRHMLRAWGWTIFVLLTVGLAWFWPWYVAWLLVPALLSRDRRLVNATIILCFTSLTIYLVGVPLRTYWPDARLWTALWVMGLPLLYVGYTFWRERVTGTRRLPRRVSAPESGTPQTAESSSPS